MVKLTTSKMSWMLPNPEKPFVYPDLSLAAGLIYIHGGSSQAPIMFLTAVV